MRADTAAPRAKSAKRITAEPNAGHRITGTLRWHCQSCDHEWNGPAGQKACPACQGTELDAAIHFGGAQPESAPVASADRLPAETSTSTPAGIAANDPRARRTRVSKRNGKIALWPNGLNFLGHPTWVCPECRERHEQSVCPASCRRCGAAGDPGQGGIHRPGDFGLYSLSELEAIRRHDAKAAQGVTKPPAGGTPAGEQIVSIAVKQIAPHPDNPRKHFDRAGLEELAESFRKVGVINPLTVRVQGPDLYQLVAGERRWRAAAIAKLTTVPCRVVDITDEEAYEVMIRENLDREDLDEIEKARSYQLGLAKCGLTQEAFAKRFHKSQEHVSNTIRLLALPEAWQQRLIQRQITATHARELLPYCDLPAVLESLEDLAPDLGDLSASDFRASVADAVAEASKPMAFEEYDGGGGCKFRPSKAQEQELDIRTVPRLWGGGKERRAFNVPLWNELNAAAKKRRKEKQPKPKRSPRRAESTHEDYLKRRAEQDFGRAVLVERCNYLGGQISEALLVGEHGDLADRLLLTLIASGGLEPVTEELVAGLAGKKNHRWLDESKALGAVVALKSQGIRPLVFRALMQALAKPARGWYSPQFGPVVLEWLARTLKIKPLAGWTPRVEFLEQFPESRLPALLAQFPDAAAQASGEKPTAEAILKHWPPGLIPAELERVTAKGVLSKGPAKKKAKVPR